MIKNQTKKSKYLFLFLRVAVVAAGIIWVASRMGREGRWGECVEKFKTVNIWVWACLMVVFMILGICAAGVSAKTVELRYKDYSFICSFAD